MKKSDKTENKNHDKSIISFFDEKIPWWTEIYREDLPKGFFSFEMRQRLKFVAGILNEQIHRMDNPSVLECGCGPGDILELIEYKKCNLTGIDLNKRYIELASERVPEAKLIEGNVEQLPFPDESFDIVFAVGVLMYLKNDREAVKEMVRVAKKGGYVLISVPNYWMLHLLLDPYYILRPLAKLFGKTEQSSDDDFGESNIRRYSLPQLKRIFEGYKIQEIRLISTSFGPLRFWRKEVLPVSVSIKISEFMRKLSGYKLFSGLKYVGNQFILVIRKDQEIGRNI